MTALGWSDAALGEVAVLYQGAGFPKELQGRATGELGFYKVSDISRAVLAGRDTVGPAAHCISRQEATKLRATPIPANAVVFARIGEAIGLNRRAMLSTESLVDNNVVGVKAKDGIADRYLLHFLRTIKLRELSQATTVPAVRTSDLAAIRLPIPPSAEQQRIVSRIEELFSDIAEGERALERVGQLVERYRQSVLKAAVTGELTREWRTRQGSSARPASAPPSDLPPGWMRANLGALSTKITSGSRDWKGFYGRGDGVFIMAQNVRPGRLDLTERQLVDPPADSKDAERSQVAEEDLLVTIVGANTGDVCRVDRPLHKHYVCQSVALIRLADPRLSPFIELFLMADEGGQAQFAETIYGAGRPHLSFDQIKAVNVPLPPAEERAAILDAVRHAESQLEALLGVAEASRRQAAALRQSILKAAFSGQLVPQDPNDEPASALLARLAAQPAAAPAAPRRRARKATA